MEEEKEAIVDTGDIVANTEDIKILNEEEDQEKADDATINTDITGEGLEEAEGEQVEGEPMEGEHLEAGENALGEGEELAGEEIEAEHVDKDEQGEKIDGQENKEEQKALEEEILEEEEQYVEEPPPDPTAPFNFTDSKEALREAFQLRPDQLAEVEQLWDYYQNCTPAYSDINNYITAKELVFMLKSILLLPVTPEQLQELIDFCVRPPHPEGHITYEQFLNMVTMRQRDFPIEEELRAALQIFDPDRTGTVDRENLKEVLAKHGHKMSQRLVENLIKEVDMANDGTIGIEDVVGTMCIDLNKEDLMMLMASLNQDGAEEIPEDDHD